MRINNKIIPDGGLVPSVLDSLHLPGHWMMFRAGPAWSAVRVLIGDLSTTSQNPGPEAPDLSTFWELELPITNLLYRRGLLPLASEDISILKETFFHHLS